MNFKDYVLENTLQTKEEFFKANNIKGEDEDDLDWLGKGDFGEAYDIGDGRVLKITSSKSEFEIAQELEGKNAPILSHLVKIFKTGIVKTRFSNEYLIVMEKLRESSKDESLFDELSGYLQDQDLPIQYTHELDTSELELSSEMESFISDIEDIVRSYRYLGIEASDIKADNLGRDKAGKLKAFDIDDRAKKKY